MKQSNILIPMAKDVTSQAVAKSHIYALKAGFIHQTAAGIYSYLPLATKTIQNIEKIVREELEKIEANEVILPLLEPAELWEKTGRWQGYGSELIRVKDRKDTEFALAPTHEEVATDLVKNYLNSYKKFPVNIFQIGTKMRDEARPRFGLIRGREFVMMDGYSFHTDNESLNDTYEKYYQAYINIFRRIGLDFKIVTADNGQMGGSKSHEFMALADIGEDTIVYEEANDIAYNLEIAPVYTEVLNTKAIADVVKVSTPNQKTISELTDAHNIDVKTTIKAVMYNVDEKLVIAFVRGDREVNELKVLKAVNGAEINMADQVLLDQNNVHEGFVGPIGLNEDIQVIVDNEVANMQTIFCGANEVDVHLNGVNYTRDFSNYQLADLREITQGEKMTKDGAPVKFARGIEIGHIFALGQKYTESLEVEFLDQNQKKQTPTMGCYGIGVSRILSAIIEQNNDENGMILPSSIAPFDVHMLPLDYLKKEEQREFSDKLYTELTNAGFKVLLDDTKERPGVKFAQADLLGLPVQIVIGRSFTEGIVEIKKRNEKERVQINVSEVKEYINGN